MRDGYFFKFSSRTFVKNPFSEEEFGVISPRAYQNFKARIPTDAEYFSSSILNSFPSLDDRARFLNKFYQCFLCHQLPHKTRKLVCVGQFDSGKTSWNRVFHGIIPASKMAVLTKEEKFGASMIQDDTELLCIDEWNKSTMTDDMLKTVLQGGFFAQAIKHAAPKMQQMNAGVYLTCNNVPNFGAEQENVERRLYICQTITLPEKASEAPMWIQNNAMHCIAWMAGVINSNEKKLENEERFYERPRNVRASALLKNAVSTKDLNLMLNSTILAKELTPAPENDEQTMHSCFAKGTYLCMHFKFLPV